MAAPDYFSPLSESLKAVKNPRTWQWQSQQFNCLTRDQLLQLGAQVCYQLALIENRPFTSNGVNRLKDGEEVLRFKCSRYGKSKPQSDVAVRERAGSVQKVDCKVTFQLSREKGLVFGETQHCERCIAVKKVESHSSVYPLGLPANQADSEIKKAQKDITDDRSIEPKNIKRRIENAAESSGEALPPRSYLDRIVRLARHRANNSIGMSDSVTALINILELGEYGRHQVVRDTNDMITMIQWMDPKLFPENVGRMTVFQKDVTFNIVNPQCGFPKASSISCLGIDRSVHILSFALILHEDRPTFESEMRFFVVEFPHLPDTKSLWLQDEDLESISACQAVLPLSSIRICFLHKFKNFVKHSSAAVQRKAKPVSCALDNLTRDELRESCREKKLAANGTKINMIERLKASENNSNIAAPSATPQSSSTAPSSTLEASSTAPSSTLEAAFTAPSSTLEASSTVPSAATPETSSISRASLEEAEDEHEEDSELLNREVLPEKLRIRKSLTYSASQWFYFLKSAESVAQAMERLSLFAREYPTQKSYVEGNLTKTIKFWADIFFSWDLDFGIDVSSLHEGVHNTWKSQLKNNVLQPNVVPDYLRQRMRLRDWHAVQRNEKLASLSSIQDRLKTVGFGKVVDVMEKTCSKEAQAYFLNQLNVADGYQHRSVVPSAEVLTLLEKAMQKRGGSAARFKMLLEICCSPNNPHGIGYLFAIHHNSSTKAEDLVFLSQSGWLACTCGDFARRGGPCRHVWRIFKAENEGYAFNPILHLHPLWLIDESLATSDVSDILQFSVLSPTSGPSAVRPMASVPWDVAVELTKTAWNDHMLRSLDYDLVQQSSIHTFPILSQSVKTLSKKDELKKKFHQILAGISNEDLAEVNACFEKISQRRNNSAIRVALQRGSAEAVVRIPQGKRRRIKD